MTSWIGSSRRARLVGVLVLVVTFLAGALSGAAATRVLSAREAPGVSARADARGAMAGGERVVVRRDGRRGDFIERLDLTPAQKVAVDGILERSREKMDAFWDENRPRMHAIVEETRAEIRGVLTPEQLTIEEQIWAERRVHYKRRGSRNDSTKVKEETR